MSEPVVKGFEFQGYFTNTNHEQSEVFTREKEMLHYWCFLRPIGSAQSLTREKAKAYDPGSDILRRCRPKPYVLFREHDIVRKIAHKGPRAVPQRYLPVGGEGTVVHVYSSVTPSYLVEWYAKIAGEMKMFTEDLDFDELELVKPAE